jgi:hypothetical protein
MNDKLSLRHGRKYRFDNSRIDIVHDLLRKMGNVQYQGGGHYPVTSLRSDLNHFNNAIVSGNFFMIKCEPKIHV